MGLWDILKLDMRLILVLCYVIEIPFLGFSISDKCSFLQVRTFCLGYRTALKMPSHVRLSVMRK